MPAWLIVLAIGIVAAVVVLSGTATGLVLLGAAVVALGVVGIGLGRVTRV